MRPPKPNESGKPVKAPETRRRWGRYPTHGVSVKVRYQDREWDAFAMDESIGGLGLRTLEPTGLETGEVVELVYHGVEMLGNVSFVGTDEDGYYRVSISWQEPETNRSRELPFFPCGEVNVVCTFQAEEEGESGQIKLWDGKQFNVAKEQLRFLTRNERHTELLDLGPQRNLLAQIYGINVRVSPEVLIERVLDFEFNREHEA